eukprot:CAMPEP_0167758864 /NCGR_PEP_ID=MMETSP0110_2-20121227/10708_1 /TAXON_ID=629695 /ORGANISM="Gymnochlora sp., Strain CCMP2014" /LENGTH=34 /DNA_ID= /DNA_START= /DNA_END= /DNA_ORIENTATION=
MASSLNNVTRNYAESENDSCYADVSNDGARSQKI